MTRFLLTLLLAGLSFGCATGSSTLYSLAEGDSMEFPTRRVVEPVESSIGSFASEPAPIASAESLPLASNPFSITEFEPTPRTYAPILGDDDSNSYTVLKAGYYAIDEDSIEDGLIVNAAFGRKFGGLLALELEIGYLDGDGADGGFQGDLWAIPVMLNGRIDIQILIVSLYGGVGIGGFYFDIDKDNGVVAFEDDGFLLGGNAFIGASLVVGGLSAGVEAKLYVTEDIDDFDDPLGALAVMFTLGFGV